MFGNNKKNNSRHEEFTHDIFLWDDSEIVEEKKPEQVPVSHPAPKTRRIAKRDLLGKEEKKSEKQAPPLSEEAGEKKQESAPALQGQESNKPRESGLLPQRPKRNNDTATDLPLPQVNQTLDLDRETLASFLRTEEKKEKGKETKSEPKLSLFGKRKKTHGKAVRQMDQITTTQTLQDAVKASLDGMYGVYLDPKKNQKKRLSVADTVRYAILFVCIFGFFSAGFFVFQKLFDYYRAYVVYSGLQEMVAKEDFFASEYLKKTSVSLDTITPAEILEGKTPEGSDVSGTFTQEQATLVGKIAQLKKINPDTAGWITINGTVVNYPLVWSEKRNYYLHRDFYGKTLSGGAIFIDERNNPDPTKNRNTVIYGHNMSDGSMFASIHDFANASVFYGTKIEIATKDGIFVYSPFSVHSSNAFDNYFETDFVSDDDFLDFCEQMAFISLFETEYKFNKNSQIITLSTCMENETATDNRFAVHAVLTKVIR